MRTPSGLYQKMFSLIIFLGLRKWALSCLFLFPLSLSFVFPSFSWLFPQPAGKALPRSVALTADTVLDIRVRTAGLGPNPRVQGWNGGCVDTTTGPAQEVAFKEPLMSRLCSVRACPALVSSLLLAELQP